MKRLYPVVLLILTYHYSNAQYQFTKLTDQTYTELTNPDYVVYDTTIYWEQVKTRVDMYFKAFGKQYDLYDFVFIPIKQGYFYFTNSTHSTTVYAAKGIFDARPGKGQQSTFSFKTETFGGKKVFTAQWKNLGFINGDSTHFINFQAKLIEDQERIEFHFGPSYTKNGLYENGANGPTIGILEMDAPFSTIYTQLWLSGSPQSPSVVKTSGVVNLNGTPANGTVYRFAYAASGLKSAVDANGTVTTSVTNNKMTVNLNDKSSGTYNIEIHDIKGALVYKNNLTPGISEIECILTNGLYTLTIFNNVTYYNRKVFVP